MRIVLLILALIAGALSTLIARSVWGGGRSASCRVSSSNCFPRRRSRQKFQIHLTTRPLRRTAQAVAGLAFWTTEIEPLERGYDGPIKILVGMDTKGILTGIIVASHNEPYGDFSVDRPEFAAQFKGKSIRDPFRVGGDIDAVSRATITVTSAARAIRISARRMATQLLAPPAPTK